MHPSLRSDLCIHGFDVEQYVEATTPINEYFQLTTLLGELQDRYSAADVNAVRQVLRTLGDNASQFCTEYSKEMNESGIPWQLCSLLYLDIPNDLKSIFLGFVISLTEHIDEGRFLLDAMIDHGLHTRLIEIHNSFTITCLTKLIPHYERVRMAVLQSELICRSTELLKDDSTSALALFQTLSRTVRNVTEIELLLGVIKRAVAEQSIEKIHFEFLKIAKSFIHDYDSAGFVLHTHGFFEIAREKLSSKFKNVVVMAITFIGIHFKYSNEFLGIDLPHFVKLAKSRHDSIASAALWVISNMILSDAGCIGLLVQSGIIDAAKKSMEDGSMKQKMESLAVMSLMVERGNQDARMFCIGNGFITYFVTGLNITLPDYIDAILPPLFELLSLQVPEAWAEFEANDGPDIVSDLLDDESLGEQIHQRLETINQMYLTSL